MKEKEQWESVEEWKGEEEGKKTIKRLINKRDADHSANIRYIDGETKRS